MNVNRILKVIIPVLLSVTLFGTNSCTYKNAEDAYPCATGVISFSKDVEPILNANCYRCHSTANALSQGQGYVLEGYANDTQYVNKASGDILYGNIADPNVQDVSHMPQNAPSLSPCDIAKIKLWIDQGYKNN